MLLVLHAIPAQDPAYVPRSANEDSPASARSAWRCWSAPRSRWLSPHARAPHDRRRIALALSLPVYIVLLALTAKYNIWITRFLIVPVVLDRTALRRDLPQPTRRAGRDRRRGSDGRLHTRGRRKQETRRPLRQARGTCPRLQALEEFAAQPTGQIVAASLVAYDRLVPPRACVGAVLDPDEPAYLLWGPQLRHQGVLPALARPRSKSAYSRDLEYVVISTGVNAPVSKQFAAARLDGEAARHVLAARA